MGHGVKRSIKKGVSVCLSMYIHKHTRSPVFGTPIEENSTSGHLFFHCGQQGAGRTPKLGDGNTILIYMLCLMALHCSCIWAVRRKTYDAIQTSYVE